MKIITIEISPGELIDRRSILKIKLFRFEGTNKFEAVKNEFSKLEKIYADADLPTLVSLVFLQDRIFRVNSELFDILDEQHNCSEERFLEIARRVMSLNEERAALKRRVDQLFGAKGEEKSFLNCQQPVKTETKGLSGAD